MVTRQPQKSSTSSGDTGAPGGRAADEDDDDDDIVAKCDDFDKYALEENADGRSLHLVEATAVRTLVANSGSVAILGTTAKCKSLGSSPAVHQSSLTVDRQHTWSPSSRSPIVGSRSHPELQKTDRQVTVTADAEPFEIPVETIYSKLEPEMRTDNGVGMPEPIRFVKATAVRYLAAETGSIAILASTAVQQPPAEDVTDRMPVGVREVLDSEPGEQLGEQPDRESVVPRDFDPRIPLPVVLAMEAKPGDGLVSSDRIFRPIEGAVPGCSSLVETSTRKPLLRQSNETGDKYCPSSDGWTPTIPVFAKCLPAKSKSK